ncbi:hypothetical protein [Helicobacter sp. 23-1045]
MCGNFRVRFCELQNLICGLPREFAFAHSLAMTKWRTRFCDSHKNSQNLPQNHKNSQNLMRE